LKHLNHRNSVVHPTFKKCLLSAMIATVCTVGNSPYKNAYAGDIAVDTAAALSNQAGVSQSLNGTQVLNIVSPTASGLSHNQFSDFNVQQQGLVINNSNINAISNIGGAVVANPNLAANEASLILNEVTSGNRSQLLGPQELLGGQAGYILANPNGITCDGCGFINFPRATLTTGTPVLSGGTVSGFDVNDGDIVINSLGLNVEDIDSFDIISRSMVINGQINAKDLNLIAGKNTVSYQTLDVVANADDASANPTFSIDSSVLGGMYVNRIRLVGTEAGVGVRLLGDVAATVDDITLSNNGQIIFSGNKLTAERDISLVATDTIVDNATVKAREDAVISTDNLTLQNSGFISAGDNGTGNLDINVSQDLNITDGGLISSNTASIDANNIIITTASNEDGTKGIHSAAAANVTATSTIDNSGFLGSDSSLTVNTLILNNNTGGVISSAATVVTATTSLDNSGNLASDSGLTVNTQVLNNTTDGVISSAETVVTATTSLANSGYLGSDSDLTVNSLVINNKTGGVINSTGSVTLSNSGASGTSFTSEANSEVKGNEVNVTYDTVNNAGDIYGTTSGSVIASSLTNTGKLSSLGTFTLTQKTSNGTMTNNSGDIEADIVDLSFDTLTNSGTIYAETKATLTVDDLTNTGASAEIYSLLDLWINSVSNGTTLTNTLGSIKANTLKLGFDDITNSGELFGTQSWGITTSSLSNSGAISSSNTLTLQQQGTADTLTNSGSIDAEILSTIFKITNNIGGTLFGNTSQTLATTTLTNSGDITSKGSLGLTATSVTNSGDIIASGAQTISATTINNTGKIASLDTLSLLQTGTGTLNNNAGGVINSTEAMTVTFNTLSNLNEIIAEKNATLTVNNLTNNDVISSKTGLLKLTQSGSGTLTNNSGAEISGHSLDIDFDTLTNAGLISGTTSAAFNSSGNRGAIINNNLGGVIVADTLNIFFDTVNNTDKLFSFTSMNVAANTLTNKAAIQSIGSITLSVTELNNLYPGLGTAEIIANNNITINDNHILLNQDLTQAEKARIISKNGNIDITSTSGSSSTQSVINNGGFIFASTGIDIDVTRQFINQNNASIYSNSGTIDIGATSTSALQWASQDVMVKNSDSVIENYLGDIDIIASVFENTTSDTVPTVTTTNYTQTSGSFVDQNGDYHTINNSTCASISNPSFAVGNTCTSYVDVTDQALSYGVSSAPKSYILAGNDINIWLESSGLNKYSVLSAGNDININGTATEFKNEALTLTDTYSAIIQTDSSGGSAVAANLIGECDWDYDVGEANSKCYWVLSEVLYIPAREEYWKGWLADFSAFFTPVSYFTTVIGSTVEAGNKITINVPLVNTNGLSATEFVKGFSEGGAAVSTSASSSTNSDSLTITVNDQGTSLSPTSVTDSVDTSNLPSITISTLDLSPIVIDSISSLASSPFFTASNDPTSQFLFETDPSLINLDDLYSSNLFIESLDLEPDSFRRLGDAYYEQQLIRQQLFAEAGQRFIANGLVDENEQYKYLLDNATQEHGALQLRVGIALTEEQINNLQKDIVWMVEVKVNGEMVLVPQLYLSNATRENLADGAKFVAKNIDVTTDGPITNSGAFVASNNINLDSGESITNLNGTISAGSDLNIKAQNDIINEGGNISGNDVTLETVDGSIINRTLTTETTATRALGSGTNTQLGQTATIESRGKLTLDSGKDILSEGGNISSEGDATLTAENDITFTGIEKKTYTETFTSSSDEDGNNQETQTSQVNANIGSGLSVGGNLSATSKNDITIEGSTVEVTGDASLDAGGDITITAKEQSSSTHTVSKNSQGLSSSSDDVTVDQTTGSASLLTTGGSLNIKSGGDTNVVGSDIGVEGDLNVDGIGGDLNITAFEETTVIHSEHTESSFLGGGSASADLGDNNVTPTVKAEGTLFTSSSETLDINSTTNRGSNIVIGGNLNAGVDENGDAKISGDANIVGSNIATGGNLDLAAGGDINVLAAVDTTTVDSETSESTFTISGEGSTNGAEGGFGFEENDTSGSATQTTSQVSSLSSGNNMNLNAGGDFTEQGTQVTAGGDITVEADKINSLAAQDTYTETGESLSVTVGLGAQADVGIGGLVDSFVDDKGGFKPDVADATNALSGLSVPDAGDVSANLSVSVTQTSTTGNGNSAKSSSFSSGGNTSFTAREGDATFEGTDVNAGGDINVTADKGSINILTADSSDSSTSDTTQVDAEIGVSGDGTVSASGSGGTSHSDSSNTSQKAASFTAGGNVDLTAKKDVTLVGTNVEAGDTIYVTAEEGKIDILAARSTTETNEDSNSTNANVSVSAAPGAGEYGAGGGHSEESSSSSSSTGTVASLSGSNIQLKSKKDITLEGTNMNATNELGIETEGKLDYQAVEDTFESSKTGMSAQVDVSASKTGGSLGVAGSGTEESEARSTKTGGTLNAGNLTIKAGKGARLEGTQVNADSASIDTGEGALVIESAVSTHTKNIDNAAVDVSVSGDVKDGGGSGSLQVDAEFEDTDTRTNQNAALNIGGNLKIKGDGGVVLSGKDTDTIEDVVTAKSIDVDRSKVVVGDVRTDKNESTKSKVGISVGLIVPNKKSRKKIKDKATRVSNSNVGTKLKNSATNTKTKLKNIGQNSDTKKKNNDAASETKQKRNSDQADFKEKLADTSANKAQAKKDQKANSDQQKADNTAEKKRDTEVAAVDKDTTLSATQKADKKKDLETDFTQAKKDNADTSADTKKQNAQEATDTKQAQADKTETLKTEAATKLATSKEKHAEVAEKSALAKAEKTTDQNEKNKIIDQAKAEKKQSVEDASSEKERNLSDIQSEKAKTKEAKKIEGEKQQADIAANTEADKKKKDIELTQANKDKDVDNDSTLSAEDKTEKKEQNAKDATTATKDVDKELAAKKEETNQKAKEEQAVASDKLEKEKSLSEKTQADKKTETQLEKDTVISKAEETEKLGKANDDHQVKLDDANTLRDDTVSQAKDEHKEKLVVADKQFNDKKESAALAKTQADEAAKTGLDEKNNQANERLKTEKTVAQETKKQFDDVAKDLLDQKNKQINDDATEKLATDKTAAEDVKTQSDETAKAELDQKNKSVNEDQSLSDAEREQKLKDNFSEFSDTRKTAKDEHDQKVQDAESTYSERDQKIQDNFSEFLDTRKEIQNVYDQNIQTLNDNRDQKLKDNFNDFSDARENNNQELSNQLSAANDEHKQTKQTADTEKDVALADAVTRSQTSKVDADSELANSRAKIKSENIANKQEAQAKAADKKTLTDEGKKQRDTLSDATLEQAKEERKILADDTIDEATRSQQLKDNADKLADAQETAKTKYVDELQKTQDGQYTRDKQKEVNDIDPSLSAADKQTKQDEIDTKYDDLKQQNQSVRDQKVSLLEKEAKNSKDKTNAEHANRIATDQSNDELKQAKTDAQTVKDASDVTRDSDKDTRDQTAADEKTTALSDLASEAGLSQEQKDTKKQAIDDAYDSKIAESKKKHQDESATIQKKHDQDVADAAAKVNKDNAHQASDLKKTKDLADSTLIKEHEDAAIQNDPKLTDAQKAKKLAENQSRFEKRNDKVTKKTIAAKEIADGNEAIELAKIKQQRADALVDANTALTDKQKTSQKAANLKEFTNAEAVNNKKIDNGKDIQEELLTSEEKQIILSQNNNAAEGEEALGLAKTRQKRAIKRVLKKSKAALGAVSIGAQVDEFGEESVSGAVSTTPLLDKLNLSEDVSSENKALAFRLLNDPDVNNAAVVKSKVKSIQNEARSQTIKDLAKEKYGSDKAVLTPADKREILTANGVDVNSVSLIEVSNIFELYLDEAVKNVQPNVSQKTEMLVAIGKETTLKALDRNLKGMTTKEISEAFNALSDVEINMAFTEVVKKGDAQLIKVASAQLNQSDSKVQELKKLIFSE
jgi:filamentous hemagglutinin